MKCRNPKCKHEFHRHYRSEEFDKLQYSGTGGISCYDCGYEKMMVIRSNKLVKDGFQPGFQRNIRKHCATYSEYKAHLKNMGLIEMGPEDVPVEDPDKAPHNYWSDAMLKKVYNKHGIKITDREAEHLKSGAT